MADDENGISYHYKFSKTTYVNYFIEIQISDDTRAHRGYELL